MPETASAGMLQVAETDQLPQSTSPVAASRRQAGCWLLVVPAFGIVSTFRAPKPL